MKIACWLAVAAASVPSTAAAQISGRTPAAAQPSPEDEDERSRRLCLFGRALAAVGDVDKDGKPDFLICDPAADDGAVWMVSTAHRHSIYRCPNLGRGAEWSSELRALGDINGDGVCDWVCAGFDDSRLKENSSSLSSAAKASDTASTISIRSGKDGSVLRSWADAVHGQILGCCAGSAGDWDGDGVPDVALGALRVEGSGGQRGVAYVFSGRTGAMLATLGSKLPAGTMAVQVLCAGDVNADGHPDLVVGCIRYGEAPSEKERHTWVIFSGTNGDMLLRCPGPRFLDGVQAAARLGDLDGDGAEDVLLAGEECVRVLSGRSGSTIRELAPVSVGPERGVAETSFGTSATWLHSRSGNAASRLIISAELTDLWGGALYSYSLKDWTQIGVAKERSDDVHHLGHRLENLGDVDGDGMDDLLCAIDNCEGATEGLAFVYSGATMKKLFVIRRRGPDVVMLDP